MKIKTVKSVKKTSLDFALKKLKSTFVFISSTAVYLALSACGRVRSTTEVPASNDSSNIPTAFDDNLRESTN